MFSRFMQDNFLGAVIVLAVLGLILGIVGTYVVLFISASQQIFESIFRIVGGGG